MDFSDAETAPTISLSRGCRSGGFQDALGTHAGLRHRNGQSKTPIAERVSGGGEPDPERSDQGSLAAFGRRKGDVGRDRSPAGSLWRTRRATAKPDRKLVVNKFDGSRFRPGVGRPRIDGRNNNSPATRRLFPNS